MTKSAAAAKTTVNVHEFVGQRLKELRGKMPPSDFARRYGFNQALLSKIEGGEPSCLARIELIAEKLGVKVASFFPHGKIPDDYPEH